MIMEYEVTWENHIYFLKELFGFGSYLLIGCLIFVYIHPNGKYITGEIAIASYVVTQILPCLFIHYQYLKYNEATKVRVDTTNKMMTIEENRMKHIFHFSEIKSLHLAMMADLYDGGKRGISAHVMYHYAYLKINNGDQFIITCLLIHDLRKFFKDLDIEYTKDKIFWPMVRMNRYKIK
jgi:hypothetical protein